MTKIFGLFTRGIIILCLISSSFFISVKDVQASVPADPSASAPAVTSVVPGNVYIPKGTMIKCETITPANSGKNNVGDTIVFKTVENLVINGVVIIPAGTAGEAVVKSVKRAGAWGKGGGIELEARATKTVNNIQVPLSLDTKKYGGGQAMVVPWLLVGVFSGFINGKNQDIPTGTKFSVAVDADVDLATTPEGLKDSMKSPVASVVVGGETVVTTDKKEESPVKQEPIVKE